MCRSKWNKQNGAKWNMGVILHNLDIRGSSVITHYGSPWTGTVKKTEVPLKHLVS